MGGRWRWFRCVRLFDNRQNRSGVWTQEVNNLAPRLRAGLGERSLRVGTVQLWREVSWWMMNGKIRTEFYALKSIAWVILCGHVACLIHGLQRPLPNNTRFTQNTVSGLPCGLSHPRVAAPATKHYSICPRTHSRWVTLWLASSTDCTG